MAEKIMIPNKPKMPDEQLPLVNVAPGYGRFCKWHNKEGTDFIFVFYASPDHLDPGVGVVPPEEDRSKWEPIIGIHLTDPGSADAWAGSFRTLAKEMRRLAALNELEDIKEAVSDIQEEKSNEDGSETTE